MTFFVLRTLLHRQGQETTLLRDSSFPQQIYWHPIPFPSVKNISLWHNNLWMGVHPMVPYFH
jgi:hypothetical protein